MVAGLRSEKQALESSLYEAQQVNARLDSLKQQLESENRELLVKKDNLQGLSSRSFTCRSGHVRAPGAVGFVRIGPICFLAGCRKRRLNQG